MMKQRVLRFLALRVLGGALAIGGLTCGMLEEVAHAQEILLTGPLAGAPAVRKQRLYRKGRFEIAPSVSFTLLDEYQRIIMVGGRLNYNITDWLAIGAWGAFSPEPLKLTASLTDEIQKVNATRQQETADNGGSPQLDHRLTAVNMGKDFEQQLGTMDWAAAPQITLVPFRGKIGLFESVYIDTDFYLFGGVGFVGLTERASCDTDPNGSSRCAPTVPGSVNFDTESRMTIAPTFGLGLSFYVAKWGALSAEWRALPFERNLGGFDNHGGGPNDEFPDLDIDDADREFRFNQMITIAFGVSLPFDYEVSE
jgi:hypothetical protein